MSSAAASARARLAVASDEPDARRIRGIDVARALAVLGMVMVHVGPVRTEGFGLAGAAYRLPHGRASILFVVVAGIGVSLLAGDRRRERVRGTTARLLWRALVLLPAGLALQTLPTNVAVILHFYAFYFLLAILTLRLSDRALLWLGGVIAALGPVAVLVARQAQPGWFAPGDPEWTDVGHVARDLVLSGTYPAAVWAAPLLAGIWAGRQDLRSSTVAWRLAAGGALLAAASFGAHHLLAVWVGTPGSETDWRQLAALEPHNRMALWLLSSTGIALTVIGSCVLLARALPRSLWALAALGELALSVYVAHLLVLALRPDLLERDTFASAWWSLGRFALVVLVLVAAWRAVAGRGPLEALLQLPWWLSRKLSPPPQARRRRSLQRQSRPR